MKAFIQVPTPQQTNYPPSWKIYLDITTLVLLVVGAGVAINQLRLLRRQFKATHDWNRRKSAHDTLSDIILGEFVVLRRKLEDEIGIHPYDPSQTYTTEKEKLNNHTYVLRDFLNYLEQVCSAIKHGVIDSEIAFDSIQGLISAYWRWSKPYVKGCRRDYDNILLWIEIERRVEEWDKIVAQKKRDAVDTQVGSGKGAIET